MVAQWCRPLNERMNRKILILEDDRGMQELLRVNLSKAGFETFQSDNAESALKLLQRVQPVLLLVDWELPQQSGLDFVKTVRQLHQGHMPVIMLSGHASEPDKLRAFEAGVDDFVSKPFHVRELLARINSKIRRSGIDEERLSKIEIDGLAVYPSQLVATMQGERIDLQSDEVLLLAALMAKPLQVFGRDKLLDLVYGPEHDGSDRNIDAVISRLRRKLEKAGHPPCLETVRTMGYRFAPQRSQTRSLAEGA
jgi:two-component system phosphate regulon response regulator PhoB